jgi:tRNA threonylcarbamoyladenosine biosynthesis protein TsaE
MTEYCFLAGSEQDTVRLGAALADALPTTATVALIGTLGAGKTRLVQSIGRACGIAADTVVSPTFVLCQPYSGRRMLFHMDAYRIKDDDEFLDLGPEEYFEADGLTLIEWADRVADCLPDERLEIHIEVAGHTQRQFQLVAIGASYEKALESIAERLAEGRD